MALGRGSRGGEGGPRRGAAGRSSTEQGLSGAWWQGPRTEGSTRWSSRQERAGHEGGKMPRCGSSTGRREAAASWRSPTAVGRGGGEAGTRRRGHGDERAMEAGRSNGEAAEALVAEVGTTLGARGSARRAEQLWQWSSGCRRRTAEVQERSDRGLVVRRKEGEAGAVRLACWAAEVAGLRELEELLSSGTRATGIWQGGAVVAWCCRGRRAGG